MPEPTLFDQASLQRYVEACFVNVPAAHHTALVGYYTLDGKWRVSVAYRLGDHWQCGATMGRDAATRNISGGVVVRGSW